MTPTTCPHQHVSIGAAILENFGISPKNVISFTLECNEPNMATLFLRAVAFGPHEPTYTFETYVIDKAHKIEDAAPFDIDQAAHQARLTLADWILLEGDRLSIETHKAFLVSRVRLDLPVRQRHLLAAKDDREWLSVSPVDDDESYFVPTFDFVK